jgi:large subunit ribosomal protein L25
MDNFKVNSEFRDDAGKGVARKMRAVGRVPAVLYGHKKDPVSLSIDEAQMRTILQAHPDSAIVDLDVADSGEINALVREVQRHPATGKLLHIDFQRISLDEKVRVDVPIEAQGHPVGVKDHGGILEQATRSLTVLCLPREIPESIAIDVSALNISDTIKLSDVMESYPSLEFVDDAESMLATVSPPRVEVTAEEEGEELEGEGEEAAEGAEKAEEAAEESDQSKGS